MSSYYKFSEYLKERFGCRVHKVIIDAGFTCPNIDGTLSKKGCIFCDNYSFSPPVRKKGIPLEKQIEEGIRYGKERYKAKKFIIYFQPYSNTYASVDVLKERYETVKKFPDVVGISIGTRPDCIDEEKISLIQSYTKAYEVWIEYGLQSIHNKTLKLINRNHTYEDFLKAVEITKNTGIKICAHIIIGLPEETEEEVIETAKECGRLKLDGIKIHPLYIVKGTTLEEIFLKGKYKPLTMEEYIDITSKFIGYLWKGTVIQRLTADCPPEILIGPDWIRNKQYILKKFEEYMVEKGIYQGDLFRI
ncbi:MAG: TIGR01212 family radical SAM protein [Candidatus Omnitrophica bacterium]|nr:TIGR01212 family radical SAM protein [Candidatus Omnitrophota bacterium]MCM8778129.1 TIGR01212 family radical SAM protein [Candidatus Omnitrophota bacterium]